MHPYIHVLLVEDDPAVSYCIAESLGRNIVVTGVARDRDKALALARELSPDVTLVRVDMAQLGGLDVLAELRTLSPDAKLVAVSSGEGRPWRHAALVAGADEFVARRKLARDLEPAIYRAALGNSSAAYL